jgi:hypothetical protein
VTDLKTVLLNNFRGDDKRLPGCPTKKLEDFEGLSEEERRHIFEVYH